jgi:hypothetical protein
MARVWIVRNLNEADQGAALKDQKEGYHGKGRGKQADDQAG